MNGFASAETLAIARGSLVAVSAGPASGLLRQYATGLAGLEPYKQEAEHPRQPPSVDFGLILGQPPLRHANFRLKHKNMSLAASPSGPFPIR
jgi:hypothetical protein